MCVALFFHGQMDLPQIGEEIIDVDKPGDELAIGPEGCDSCGTKAVSNGEVRTTSVDRMACSLKEQ